ncbi:MAG: rhodanese-like domain-containing protein [Desulfuromonadales bacterium]|nr:rhodanese-like domain-containing protein [Desulfuromonadales bacterium]NIR33550.1 rhodanese-like domain-containing protein [Desulfuromonadales bacterium]NIS41140.1 rhodanese-like domain-containing protein [Desulfuromonadales bacterium]
MKAKELARLIRNGKAPQVIDVRSTFEYKGGHIPGAVHMPFLGVLLRRNKLPQDKQAPLVVTCEHGPRAEVAKAQLRLFGYKNLALLSGHMAGWRREGLKLERGK